jgi:hypothetical protein
MFFFYLCGGTLGTAATTGLPTNVLLYFMKWQAVREFQGTSFVTKRDRMSIFLNSYFTSVQKLKAMYFHNRLVLLYVLVP